MSFANDTMSANYVDNPIGISTNIDDKSFAQNDISFDTFLLWRGS